MVSGITNDTNKTYTCPILNVANLISTNGGNFTKSYNNISQVSSTTNATTTTVTGPGKHCSKVSTNHCCWPHCNQL